MSGSTGIPGISFESVTVDGGLRYALIDESNSVVGVALWDGVSAWTPPPHLREDGTSSAVRAVRSDTLRVGDAA